MSRWKSAISLSGVEKGYVSSVAPKWRWSPFPDSLSYRSTHTLSTMYASLYLYRWIEPGKALGSCHRTNSAKASSVYAIRLRRSSTAFMLETIPTTETVVNDSNDQRCFYGAERQAEWRRAKGFAASRNAQFPPSASAWLGVP